MAETQKQLQQTLGRRLGQQLAREYADANLIAVHVWRNVTIAVFREQHPTYVMYFVCSWFHYGSHKDQFVEAKTCVRLDDAHCDAYAQMQVARICERLIDQGQRVATMRALLPQLGKTIQPFSVVASRGAKPPVPPLKCMPGVGVVDDGGIVCYE